MAKVFVDGDYETLDRIAAALRSAGLSTDDIELIARPPEVRQLPACPGNWAAYADLAAELSYTDWRDEVLTFVAADQAAPLRWAPADLRRAG